MIHCKKNISSKEFGKFDQSVLNLTELSESSKIFVKICLICQILPEFSKDSENSTKFWQIFLQCSKIIIIQ